MWSKNLSLLLAVSVSVLSLTQAQESWSWGADTSADTAADPVAVVSEDPPAEEQVKGRDGRFLAEEQVHDVNGRFLGIGDKLCKLGLGVHCNKKKPYEQNVKSHYQVNPHPTYNTPRPAYNAPRPAYQAPYDVIKTAYNAPNPHYPAPRPPKSVYTTPKPAYNTPNPGYQAPYDTIKTQYVAPQQLAAVQHVHSHTHIHKTGGSQVGKTVAPVYKPAPVAIPVYKPAYREQCECVLTAYCQTQDIIARRDFNDISHLLDARSEFKEGFESNATSTTEDVPRTKRETIAQGQNKTYNIEGRQLSSYNPGHNGCGHGHICCRRPVYIPPPPRYTCGRSQSSGLLGRVKTPHYQQGDAEFAEYPWQAAILRNDGHETVYVCGAALIDEQHVLTALHCIDELNPYNLRVRLGEWDVTQSSEFFSHIEVPVANVIGHQDFYKGNLKNYIAILRLASLVDFNANPHISPVCLPDQYSDSRGQQCVVTGWGKDNFGTDGKFQQVLKEVTVPIIDHNGCQNTMRQTRLGRTFNLDPGMLCAGGEEAKDACQGDGGSPLVCRNGDGSYQLTGLVSWGIGCGQRGIPGVYVNIKNYLQWIKYNTQQ